MFTFGTRCVPALGLALVGVGAWIGYALAGDRSTAQELVQAAGKADAALVKRGEYLVDVVARCGDCHTPRDNSGKLDMSRHLQGAKMWFTPKVKPRGEWEDHAPDITASGRAGRWAEAKMVKYLSTGQQSDPPMPAYRFTVDDARAVTVYLRSLAGRKKAGRRDDE
jgi:mono/diheme cytochrome c family protein